jgi:segregation and condensation protein B
MLTTTIESILFAAAKPVKLAVLQKTLCISQEVLREAIDDITARYNSERSGIHLLEHEGAVQFVTNAEVGEDVAKFLRVEASGPLTRPSLETLTIISYRAPITKPEIELIRGVNCSLILRNLLIRGYIEETQDTKRLQMVYTLSHDFLRALGISRVEDLPEYEAFSKNEKISELLSQQSLPEQGI